MLFIQTHLRVSFWAEAKIIASYIRNRCPSKDLNEKIINEIWTGKEANIKYFRKFGSQVMCPGRCNESKGYIIWIPEERRLIISRDMKFVSKMNKQENFENLFEEIELSRYKIVQQRMMEIEVKPVPEMKNSMQTEPEELEK